MPDAMNFDDIEELKEGLRRIAHECLFHGPGYAQEGVVLREARKVLDPRELAHEQMILEAWHCLFANGELDWGYDLDNPGSPFFHQVSRQPATTEGTN